jgi:hypothetical protein
VNPLSNVLAISERFADLPFDPADASVAEAAARRHISAASHAHESALPTCVNKASVRPTAATAPALSPYLYPQPPPFRTLGETSEIELKSAGSPFSIAARWAKVALSARAISNKHETSACRTVPRSQRVTGSIC